MSNEQVLQVKTKDIAIRIIRLLDALPNNHAGEIIARQIGRSGTSVGANYRAAARAKSKADMINKLKIVEEEADETLFWLELIRDANIIPESRLTSLMDEVRQVIALKVASIKTIRAGQLS